MKHDTSNPAWFIAVAWLLATLAVAIWSLVAVFDDERQQRTAESERIQAR